ncbi:glycosyltransferase [Nautilia lithotrophica]
MKKIVHLTSVHQAKDNRILFKECQTLSKNGYSVKLVCADAKNEKIGNVEIIGFPKHKSRINRMLKTSFLDMIKMCKKVDADLYHFHDPELIFVGLYLKLKGKKVIYDIHENTSAAILSKEYIKNLWVKKIISIIFEIFEKSVVKFFDALVTARPDITEKFNHKRVITLRNFPFLPKEIKKIKQKSIKHKKVVIYVGGMTKIRGIEQLINAFKKIKNAELWLLGPIKEKELYNKIKKAENVKYLGEVLPDGVFDYIQKADIGIVTFLPAPNHVTTLPTKPFEYMACGLPMVMSNFEYWKNFFNGCALFANPLKEEEIIKAIDELVNNDELRNKIGERNKKLIFEEYNWEKESQKLLNLYKELLC